jgi:hypothetical protein
MKLLLLLIAVVVLLGPARDKQAVAAETKPDVSAQDVKKETKEALEATKEYTVQQKKDFQKEMRVKLDRVQEEIDRLTAKAKHAKKEAQAELNEEIEELRKKKDAAGKYLEKLESASGKAWSDLRSSLNTIMEDLEKSYKRALSRFP